MTPLTREATAPPRPERPEGLLDALDRHARTMPHRIAIAPLSPDAIADGLTWSRLREASLAVAATITDHCPSSRAVLLRALNSIEFVCWFLGSLRAGRRLLPLHPGTPDPEGRDLASLAAVGLVVGDAPAVPRVNRVALTLGPAPASPPSAPRASGGIVLASSGTTGTPRLVYRDTAALAAVGVAVASGLRLSAEDRLALAIPLCHSYGIDMLCAGLIAGTPFLIQTAFDPVALASACSSGPPVVLPGVPFMFDALARCAPAPLARPSLRLAVSAGAPLAPATAGAFARAWGRRVGQIYGATELGSATFNDPDDPDFDASSAGRPLPGVSVRILDAHDPSLPAAPGEEGQVAVRAASMLSGYIPGGPPALVDGHLPTGDLGRIDDRGRLHITGRTKLLIDIGGLKVNPLEVERALCAHPGVLECVVDPMPLSATVIRLRARVLPRHAAQPPTEASLRSFLKQRLAPHKVPRTIEAVDSLPRTASGKVRRALSHDGDAA